MNKAVKTAKQWNDQPECVLGCVVFLHIFVNGRGVEVRKDDDNDCWYVSVGNLFGSQTLRVANAENVLRVVHIASNASRSATLEEPPGCELL